MKEKLVAARLEPEQYQKLLGLATAHDSISAALRWLIDQSPEKEAEKGEREGESGERERGEVIHV
jgi:hypothetical protein